MILQKIMVLGVGNILREDEGVGIHATQALSRRELPPNVEILEGGTAGIELLHLIEEVDHLVVIDAMDAKAEPGAIFKFQPGDVSVFPDNFGMSFHQVGLLEVLNMAKILDKLPETMIFGIQPQSMDWGLELTPALEAKLPRLLDLVEDYIKEINS
ncbi:MAG: HyaD/HybD family hydrogenase maturation endopeptidase [Clostridia bacterium]|nr:HyaD/HybD family hydrogenase maturation endopeptidase [Clostridia bacterium]